MFKQLKKFFTKRQRIANRRRFRRFRADFLVKYQVDPKEGAKITNARDVGAGGLKFWSEEKLPESSLLHVSIYIPPLHRVVEGSVRVLRVKRVKKTLLYSIAVSFLELKQEDRDEINRFAESLSKEKGAQFLIDHADVVIRRP